MKTDKLCIDDYVINSHNGSYVKISISDNLKAKIAFFCSSVNGKSLK